MGKLHDQLQRDLEIKGYSPQTRQAYLTRVCDFVQHFNRPPKELGREEVSTYLQYLLCERKLSQSYLSGRRFVSLEPSFLRSYRWCCRWRRYSPFLP